MVSEIVVFHFYKGERQHCESIRIYSNWRNYLVNCEKRRKSNISTFEFRRVRKKCENYCLRKTDLTFLLLRNLFKLSKMQKYLELGKETYINGRMMKSIGSFDGVSFLSGIVGKCCLFDVSLETFGFLEQSFLLYVFSTQAWAFSSSLWSPWWETTILFKCRLIESISILTLA